MTITKMIDEHIIEFFRDAVYTGRIDIPIDDTVHQTLNKHEVLTYVTMLQIPKENGIDKIVIEWFLTANVDEIWKFYKIGCSDAIRMKVEDRMYNPAF